MFSFFWLAAAPMAVFALYKTLYRGKTTGWTFTSRFRLITLLLADTATALTLAFFSADSLSPLSTLDITSLMLAAAFVGRWMFSGGMYDPAAQGIKHFFLRASMLWVGFLMTFTNAPFMAVPLAILAVYGLLNGVAAVVINRLLTPDARGANDQHLRGSRLQSASDLANAIRDRLNRKQ